MEKMHLIVVEASGLAEREKWDSCESGRISEDFSPYMFKRPSTQCPNPQFALPLAFLTEMHFPLCQFFHKPLTSQTHLSQVLALSSAVLVTNFALQ